MYYRNQLQKDILEIYRYTFYTRYYWRLRYTGGREKEFSDRDLNVVSSCLDSLAANNNLSYFKAVAEINPLKNEENENSLLGNIYSRLDFIDEDTAASPYINPLKECKKLTPPEILIYPFGCNESQKKAVETSFRHQLSVIEGPSGTGKTQTILNIIANILMGDKTVMVVSNNNSAILNIQEKLEKYNLSFLVAYLGRKENRLKFIENQPALPKDIEKWELPFDKVYNLRMSIKDVQQKLERVYSLQIENAALSQEEQAILLEWKHFCIDNNLSDALTSKTKCDSSKTISLWLKLQNITFQKANSWEGFISKIELLWIRYYIRYFLKIKTGKDNLEKTILGLQILYYLNRKSEIEERKKEISSELSHYEVNKLALELSSDSMKLFMSSLSKRYKEKREPLKSIDDFTRLGDKFLNDYPIVLSTTFSARSCLFSTKPYDYVIMDESSQVPLETGMVALTCAKNAVIVGDSLQLPNVITEEDKSRLDEITKEFEISDNYDCSKSFLDSMYAVLGDALPRTFLKEHYRCHPKIINFCNQKFYQGRLLIMTQDQGEEDVMCAVRTPIGNHAVDQRNQREVDVVKKDVLPMLTELDSIGIVTPYNNQVNLFNKCIPKIEAATIHKFQGREKDAIIMSVVDNKISEFSDDPHLLNVAVSRAKKKFCIVVTGNEQVENGNIMDLLDYIAYNNFTITDSKVSSIFDFLYEQYSKAYLSLKKNLKKVSEYDSENLTYKLIEEVLSIDNKFLCLKVLCHMPLWQIIKDKSLMNDEERKYASNYHTHVDFLIANKLSKKPVLAIETDGYAFHNETTRQHQRDILKDNIFQEYNIPLLRLSTKGSNEKERIIETLRGIRYL